MTWQGRTKFAQLRSISKIVPDRSRNDIQIGTRSFVRVFCDAVVYSSVLGEIDAGFVKSDVDLEFSASVERQQGARMAYT